MATSDFSVGDLVVNYPLGISDPRWTVSARVVEILSDGSLVVRETGLGRSCGEFVADPAKTRREVA